MYLKSFVFASFRFGRHADGIRAGAALSAQFVSSKAEMNVPYFNNQLQGDSLDIILFYINFILPAVSIISYLLEKSAGW